MNNMDNIENMDYMDASLEASKQSGQYYRQMQIRSAQLVLEEEAETSRANVQIGKYNFVKHLFVVMWGCESDSKCEYIINFVLASSDCNVVLL